MFLFLLLLLFFFKKIRLLGLLVALLLLRCRSIPELLRTIEACTDDRVSLVVPTLDMFAGRTGDDDELHDDVNVNDNDDNDNER